MSSGKKEKPKRAHRYPRKTMVTFQPAVQANAGLDVDAVQTAVSENEAQNWNIQLICSTRFTVRFDAYGSR